MSRLRLRRGSSGFPPWARMNVHNANLNLKDLLLGFSQGERVSGEAVKW